MQVLTRLIRSFDSIPPSDTSTILTTSGSVEHTAGSKTLRNLCGVIYMPFTRTLGLEEQEDCFKSLDLPVTQKVPVSSSGMSESPNPFVSMSPDQMRDMYQTLQGLPSVR
jgi:hypothetical protein